MPGCPEFCVKVPFFAKSIEKPLSPQHLHHRLDTIVWIGPEPGSHPFNTTYPPFR